MKILNRDERRQLIDRSFEHVRTRLNERYGIEIDKPQYGRLVERVKAKKRVIKLRTKQSGCVLYAVLFNDHWIPVLYDPCLFLVTTVYPRAIVGYYRRRISVVDDFMTRLQNKSCPTPTDPTELAASIAKFKAEEKILERSRKLSG